MAMTPRLYTVSALAVELGVDRRTLAKHLAAVEPADVRGRSKRWRMRDVFAALKQSWSEPKPSAYMDERTRHEVAKRELAELKLRERRSELLPLADAEHAVALLLSGVRSLPRARPAERNVEFFPTN